MAQENNVRISKQAMSDLKATRIVGSTDNNVEAALVKIKEVVGFSHGIRKVISWGNITGMVSAAMVAVESYKMLGGSQKKRVVVRVITELVDESDAMGKLEPFVLYSLPILIDQIVEADGGSLRLNRKNITKIKQFIDFLKSSCSCISC